MMFFSKNAILCDYKNVYSYNKMFWLGSSTYYIVVNCIQVQCAGIFGRLSETNVTWYPVRTSHRRRDDVIT